MPPGQGANRVPANGADGVAAELGASGVHGLVEVAEEVEEPHCCVAVGDGRAGGIEEDGCM